KTDQSNAIFSIIPAARQLTAPNGSENWIAGTAKTISWTSGSFLSTNVKIEYSIDSGANWLPIVASVTNNGSYAWTTPNTPSSRALVKISEVGNLTAFDISDNIFTISPFILLTYPNGTENLMGCEIKNITWNAGATSQHYSIEYSTDNGSTWAGIISDYNTTATNCTYSWTVNNAVSSLYCKIRVTDLFTPLKTDISDNPFSITQVTNALLISPNGGESWKVGTTQQIKYSTSGPTTAVKLYYSVDNGTNWIAITTNTSGGTYNWSVPNTPATTALIKVEDKNIACNADQSNAVFTIEPHITITAPNGGEVLYGCRSNDISWFGGGTSNYYKIEYSSNGGTTWNTIVASYYSTSITNVYTWAVIPNLSSSSCLIRISDASNPAKTDVSDAYFTITGTTDLILFTPNGNEQWQSTVGANSSAGSYLMNSNTAVTTSSGYFYDSGNSSNNYGYNENYTKTFTPEIPGNMLKFEFTTFSTYNSYDILYIYNGSSTSSPLIGSYYSSYSPGTITASNPTGQLTFRWTTDGSSVYTGWAANISSVSATPNMITWAASNTSQYYNLYYSTNSGSTWNTISSSYYTTATSYQWNIPNTPSNNCLVKIEDANNTCKSDISNSNFKIIAAKPAVIIPNGDETWYSYENHDISWANATFLSTNVVIEYSQDSGYSWNTIQASTPNDGAYTWTVPAFNKQYLNCLVRISEYGNTSVNDISNAIFKLTPPILITSPNGDNGVSNWRSCTQSTITWKAGTSSYYNIDYSINNGTTWTSVASNYYNSAANVTYTWSIPNTPSNQCLVKVSDYNSSLKTDISDSSFTISPSITLLQPNYGGVLQNGTSYSIKWTADGTSNFYDIDYSSNGGNTWNSIVYNYQSTTGIYTWTVPSTLSSNCMVRVTDNVSACKTDKSDVVFTISTATPSITVLSPNGGESINSCSPYNISWTVNGTFQTYTIEYSINGGSSWNNIVSNYSTTNGLYAWNIPNINATNCLVRVKDAANNALYDMSDASFNILQTISANITASGPTTFCTGSYVTLTSNSTSGNTWSPGGETTQSIHVINSGNYNLTVNNGSGCSAISSGKIVTVNPLPSAPFITANGSTNICAGSTVVLSSSYNTGNTWLPTAETTKDIGVSISGSYTVKYTDLNACSAISSPISVIVNQLSSAPIITASGPLTFCAGDSVILTSSSITGNVWIPGNETTQSIKIYNSGSYSVSIGNGCSAIATPVIVTVNPSPGNPIITANGATTFCNGGSVVLTSSYATGNQWSPSLQTSQSISVSTSGLYRVKIIGGNGCPAFSIPVQVTVNAIPSSPNAYSNSPVPLNGTLILTADSINGASFSWTGPNNFTSNLRIASIQNATALLNGSYTVKATRYGCEGPTASINVNVAAATSLVNISGVVHSESNANVKKVSLNLSGIEGNQSFLTGTDGMYNFNVTASNSYSLIASKNNDSIPENGISTLDIIMMQRHILNIDTLNSPYKIIAADVNGSGSVTTLDIILTRRLILHTSNFFPGNKIWSFVSSDYVFPNPKNPFPYSESKTITNASQLNNLNFIGMKLGDVNNSWNNTISKSTVDEISFFTEGQNVVVGNTIVVPVKVKDFNHISGYQYTISWDATAFKLLNVNNTAVENFFGNQEINNGKLSVLWSSEIQNGVTLSDGTTVFELTFSVIGGSNTSQEISFNSAICKAEGYNNQLELLMINAYMTSAFTVGSDVGINEALHPKYQLLQNNPNPFNDQTEIVFEIPQNEAIQFFIYNSLGEIVQTISGNYNAGINRLIWKGCNKENKALSNGSYYLQMKSKNYTGFKKIIILR
ncbi:MAG: T9SS type A sorting domain-containing protein, partial [Bacteroidota bacterium]